MHAAGGTLSVVTSGQQAVGQAQANVGQTQSIFAYAADAVSPNLSPALLGTSIKIGSTTVANPDLTPGKTVAAAAQYLKAQSSNKTSTVVPFIQDYTDTALGTGSYKNYTPSDVKAEIAVVKAAGTRGYILYNPQGSYDFSGLS